MKTEDLLKRSSKQTGEPVKPWDDLKGTINAKGLLQTMTDTNTIYQSPNAATIEQIEKMKSVLNNPKVKADMKAMWEASYINAPKQYNKKTGKLEPIWMSKADWDAGMGKGDRTIVESPKGYKYEMPKDPNPLQTMADEQADVMSNTTTRMEIINIGSKKRKTGKKDTK